MLGMAYNSVMFVSNLSVISMIQANDKLFRNVDCRRSQRRYLIQRNQLPTFDIGSKYKSFGIIVFICKHQG